MVNDCGLKGVFTEEGDRFLRERVLVILARRLLHGYFGLEIRKSKDALESRRKPS